MGFINNSVAITRPKVCFLPNLFFSSVLICILAECILFTCPVKALSLSQYKEPKPSIFIRDIRPQDIPTGGNLTPPFNENKATFDTENVDENVSHNKDDKATNKSFYGEEKLNTNATPETKLSNESDPNSSKAMVSEVFNNSSESMNSTSALHLTEPEKSTKNDEQSPINGYTDGKGNSNDKFLQENLLKDISPFVVIDVDNSNRLKSPYHLSLDGRAAVVQHKYRSLLYNEPSKHNAEEKLKNAIHVTGKKLHEKSETETSTSKGKINVNTRDSIGTNELADVQERSKLSDTPVKIQHSKMNFRKTPVNIQNRMSNKGSYYQNTKKIYSNKAKLPFSKQYREYKHDNPKVVEENNTKYSNQKNIKNLLPRAVEFVRPQVFLSKREESILPFVISRLFTDVSTIKRNSGYVDRQYIKKATSTSSRTKRDIYSINRRELRSILKDLGTKWMRYKRKINVHKINKNVNHTPLPNNSKNGLSMSKQNKDNLVLQRDAFVTKESNIGSEMVSRANVIPGIYKKLKDRNPERQKQIVVSNLRRNSFSTKHSQQSYSPYINKSLQKKFLQGHEFQYQTTPGIQYMEDINSSKFKREQFTEPELDQEFDFARLPTNKAVPNTLIKNKMHTDSDVPAKLSKHRKLNERMVNAYPYIEYEPEEELSTINNYMRDNAIEALLPGDRQPFMLNIGKDGTIQISKPNENEQGFAMNNQNFPFNDMDANNLQTSMSEINNHYKGRHNNINGIPPSNNGPFVLNIGKDGTVEISKPKENVQGFASNNQNLLFKEINAQNLQTSMPEANEYDYGRNINVDGIPPRSNGPFTFNMGRDGTIQMAKSSENMERFPLNNQNLPFRGLDLQNTGYSMPYINGGRENVFQNQEQFIPFEMHGSSVENSLNNNVQQIQREGYHSETVPGGISSEFFKQSDINLPSHYQPETGKNLITASRDFHLDNSFFRDLNPPKSIYGVDNNAAITPSYQAPFLTMSNYVQNDRVQGEINSDLKATVPPKRIIKITENKIEIISPDGNPDVKMESMLQNENGAENDNYEKFQERILDKTALRNLLGNRQNEAISLQKRKKRRQEMSDLPKNDFGTQNRASFAYEEPSFNIHQSRKLLAFPRYIENNTVESVDNKYEALNVQKLQSTGLAVFPPESKNIKGTDKIHSGIRTHTKTNVTNNISIFSKRMFQNAHKQYDSFTTISTYQNKSAMGKAGMLFGIDKRSFSQAVKKFKVPPELCIIISLLTIILLVTAAVCNSINNHNNSSFPRIRRRGMVNDSGSRNFLRYSDIMKIP